MVKSLDFVVLTKTNFDYGGSSQSFFPIIFITFVMFLPIAFMLLVQGA